MNALADAERALQNLYDTGYYPGLQVSVLHKGEEIMSRSMGQYRPIESETWEDVDEHTRFMLFSISKCVTAVAMHMMFDRHKLQVDDPVHWYVPAFRGNGKEHITLRHLLTHTSGIPMLRWKLTDELIRDWDRIIADLCASTPLHFPGRWASYHLLSGGYVLGEVLRRVDGRDLRTFVKEEISDPLGFETFNYGVAPSWYPQTAKSERVEPLPPRAIIEAINRVIQLDLVQALAVMNRPAVFEAIIPSGNVVATAKETALFFQMLLNGGELNGVRIMSERQVKRATVEQVMTRHDLTLFLTPARYSLGFMLGRKRTHINVFGKNTAQSYGHLGFTRNLAWADPVNDIAVAFLTSSKITYPRGETLILRSFQNAIRRACGG